MSKVIFEDDAWDDYLYWQETNRRILNKINALIRDAGRDPFHGIGKTEPLKEDKSGLWSRRITEEHRLVYRVEGDNLIIVSCEGHYDDK